MAEPGDSEGGPVETFLIDLDAGYGLGPCFLHDDHQAAISAPDVQDVLLLERTPRRQYAGNFAAAFNVATHVSTIGVVIYSVALGGQELIEGSWEIARIVGRRQRGR